MATNVGDNEVEHTEVAAGQDPHDSTDHPACNSSTLCSGKFSTYLMICYCKKITNYFTN